MSPSPKTIPIAREGWPFIAGFFLSGVALTFIPAAITIVAGFLLIGLGVFSCYFFRDPERDSIQDDAMVLAPGDGVVMEVSEDKNPGYGWQGSAKVVKIFLSVFDVHVQHSPIRGKIAEVQYRPGKFLDARDPRAALENESNSMVIENDRIRMVVKQVAGLIARRIVCYVKPGQTVRAGQRIGLIRFGSQVDVFLPMDAEVCVSKGERVVSAVSAIAVLKSAVAKK
jgi:phosphatidylserine decarboxylase